MKRLILICFISSVISISAFAQLDEKISELNPYPSYIEAVRNRYNNIACNFGAIVQEAHPVLSTVSIIPLRLSNNKQVTSIIARGFIKNLVFEDRGGQIQANLLITGRIISADEKIDGVFEDALFFDRSLEELKASLNEEIFYRKIVDLPKGNYKLLFNDKNAAGYSKKIKEIKFVVP